MDAAEVELLSRAHRLFAADPQPVSLTADADHHAALLQRIAERDDGLGGALGERYRAAVLAHRARLLTAAQTDAVAGAVLARATADHSQARRQTAAVVHAARADTARITPDTPLAHREALRRRAARLRTQRGHVLTARRRALAHRARLLGLHYRTGHRRAVSPDHLPPNNTRAGLAVRAALSRLGRPYVWGATGPDRFDCSGLTQWAYAQAGVHLDRTTYSQIHDGVAVSPAHIRPGDLVFPSTGHVQLAIGNNQVIEAPHAGAAVRISPLGAQVAIRRPVP
ncbi:C40 family peptidase [Mycobacterium sp. M1]|uniref:C40 family peptidase n=1 Tax=Mycolicibacter acidiphilus TaxID=2835306 RepID=A0ABS5RHG8_9MYCO|nr:C40 family peptidase [Mycolicibacter acidiphilus]MBS9533740.1 C40 family peptidase [Mycolicibacter acidiphilus]